MAATTEQALDGISLDELDARAELLKRVDVKYLVPQGDFAALLDALAADHDVLDIDGRRRFAYRSVYFDSADLRCYRDHVDGARPRFKARTRCYLDTGACHFEVKLKTRDDQTDKRQLDHPPDADDRLPAAARELLDRTLAETGIQPVGPLAPVLCTLFDRITLAARSGGSRLTCDLALRLAQPDGAEARLDERLVLVETKSADGRSGADDVLRRLGVLPLSLSKYRAGIELLIAPRDTPLRRYFESSA